MSYSIVRLTLYGLLASFEADLRDFIKNQITPSNTLTTLLGKDQVETLRRRAAQDEQGDSDDALIMYMDFGDALKILNTMKSQLGSDFVQLLNKGQTQFERMASIRNRVMHSRPLHFDDAVRVAETVQLVLKYARTQFPSLSATEQKLKENPEYALSLDIRASEKDALDVMHNLPIPDFDETGFLGRTQEANDLKDAIRGPFPVITILGEGGIGKTALALQTAYNLLDDENRPFQAIIWSSSKTTRLTATDIERIEGAIETSLGVFRSVQQTLSGQSSDSALDEVLEYLNSFKILLILDNLETVLDENIRRFLRRLSGPSKIMITSRVGVGELDFPFRLSGLGTNDARHLLRATARVRRVQILAQETNEKLSEYCVRMKNNAAFIKWFVTVVQCHTRPEDVLAKDTLFLDFCLSNVYSYLDDNARKVANALLAIPGRHSQPVISYLSGLDGDAFQSALRQLITTNIVIISPVRTQWGSESYYELGELPRRYITKNHPLSKPEVLSFQRRRREILSTHERLATVAKFDAYTPESLTLRGPDDAVAATYLIDALRKVRREEYKDAFDLIEKAKSVAPSYFEVFRVEGWANSFAGNLPAARECYESALELEPSSAPLRFWFAGFLLRLADDAEGANEQLDRALELDPGSPYIQAELGRTKMYLRKFEDADWLFEEVTASDDASLKLKRISYDGWLQSALRSAEAEYDRGEYIASHDGIKIVLDRYRAIPGACRDFKIIETLARCRALLNRIDQQLGLSNAHQQVTETKAELEDVLGSSTGTRPNDGGLLDQTKTTLKEGEVYSGYIATVFVEKKYGFIKTKNGEPIFFHQSDLSQVGAFQSLNTGQEVRFVVGHGDDGRMRAINIAIIATDRSAERFGIVRSYDESGRHFGFIFGDDGNEYFFHRNNISAGASGDAFRPGTRVRFILGNNQKGVVADEVAIERA